MALSKSLNDHYTGLVQPDLESRDTFYAYRYFHHEGFFHRKFDPPTPAKTALIKSCPGARITAFSKGSVYFPYNQRHQVLRAVAQDIESDSVAYWNQIAYDRDGEGCRLVVDVDSDSRVLQKVEVHRMASVLRTTLKAYYPDYDQNPVEIYSAMCGPRLKKGQLSTGVHFVCHVRVTIPQAKQLIFAFKIRLKSADFDMRGLELDAGIYREKSAQVSCRMIYSHKIENCPVCQNETERRQACTFCDRRGQAISRSTYEPLTCVNPLNGKPAPDRFQEQNPDFFSLTKNYSIWPEEGDDTHQYVKPVSDPLHDENTSEYKQGPPVLRKGRNSKKKCKNLKATDPAYELLQEFIRDLTWKGEQLWSGIFVENVSVTPNNKMAWIYVSGVGSTICPYAMKDHGSNRIWFSANYKGELLVYCHSKKLDECSKPENRVMFELPGRVVAKIFKTNVPPSLDPAPRSDSQTSGFTFDQFYKRKGHREEYHQRADEEETFLRKQHLARLTEFYDLGFGNDNSSSSSSSGPPKKKRKKN